MASALAAFVREKLLAIQNARFKSRRDWAAAAGMSESGLRAILKEGGHDGVTLKTLDKLLEAADISPTELFAPWQPPTRRALGFSEESDPGGEQASALRMPAVIVEQGGGQMVALGLAETVVGLVRAGQFEEAGRFLRQLRGVVDNLRELDYRRISKVPGLHE